MTAINAFLRPDRGFLMADSAHYSCTGVPMGFGSKIVTLPKLNAAVAARGLSSIVPTLAAGMSLRYDSFDDMVDRLQPDLVEWCRQNEDFLDASGFPLFELHVLGWSMKDGRPKHVLWINEEDFGDLLQEEEFVLCPDLGPDESLKRLPELGVFLGHPGFAAEFDPVRHGVPIMMAQRREVDELDGHEENGKVCIVGGHIEVTEISAEGIAQRVLHRWQDESGVLIEPEKLSPKDIMRARIAERNFRIKEQAA